MKTQVEIIAIPSVSYGKFTHLAKPVASSGNTPTKSELLLAALKKQFGYTAPVMKGKSTPRTTFAPEWIKFAQSTLNVEFIVVSAPEIKPLKVGEVFGESTESVSADFSFLA